MIFVIGDYNLQLRPFLTTPTGDIPITSSVKSGQKIRFLIIPSENESPLPLGSKLEVFNPLDMRVVNSNIPEFDSTKIVYIDIVLPNNWLSGVYCAELISGSKVISKCFFTFESSQNAPIITRTLNPKWRLNYGVIVQNLTDKPIGNLQAFVALPINIPPQQNVTDLQLKPASLKISTDIEGNHWTRLEVPIIQPKEKVMMHYSSIIENKPLIIARKYVSIKTINPYDKKFLKKYLDPEPHIESDHPKIVEMASKISDGDIIQKVKKFVKLVQKTLTYEVQPGEYGAAYAVETKKGDCTEFSALFVALCRAAGIPARTNAGFALTNNWERHAIAEFLIGGRWMPVDLTILRGGDIIMGALPTFITITRGNWMGGTLAKEFSYKYKIMESSQKLDVKIDWQIYPENGSTILNNSNKSTNIRIIEPKIIDSKTSIAKKITNNKVKILDIEDKQFSHNKLVHLNPQKITINGLKKKRNLEILVDIPDAVKRESLFQPIIQLRNHSEKELIGSFELREINNEVIRLLAIFGKKIEAGSKAIVKPKIRLPNQGTSILEFAFLNRIGRTLAKTTYTISTF